MLELRQLTRYRENWEVGDRPLLINPDTIERITSAEKVESENDLFYSGQTSRVFFEDSSMLVPMPIVELRKKVRAALHDEDPVSREAQEKIKENRGPNYQIDYHC